MENINNLLKNWQFEIKELGTFKNCYCIDYYDAPLSFIAELDSDLYAFRVLDNLDEYLIIKTTKEKLNLLENNKITIGNYLLDSDVFYKYNFETQQLIKISSPISNKEIQYLQNKYQYAE